MSQPTETQIRDCIAQITQQRPCTYSEQVQGYAQLRMADFSAVLNEWALPNNDAHSQPLPKIHQALISNALTPEQGQKWLAYVQQLAKKGQRTAVLYWSYALAVGVFTQQNPRQAVHLAQQLVQRGDWRAARWLGEMLANAPMAAPEILANECQAACTQWQAQHPEHSAEQVQAACQRFTQNAVVIKHRAKQYLEQAIALGSPTANQRLRGLTALGKLSAGNVPARYRDISAFLQHQLNQAHLLHEANDDPDIFVLPEHIQWATSEENEQPAWYRPAVYGAVALTAVLFFTLLTKLFFFK